MIRPALTASGIALATAATLTLASCAQGSDGQRGRRPPPPVTAAAACPVRAFGGASGKSAVARGLSANGRYVIGVVDLPSGAFNVPTIWRDGKVTSAAEKAGGDFTSINDDGIAAGSIDVRSGESQQASVMKADGATKPLRGGGSDSARAINEAGKIVGVWREKPAVWSALNAEPKPLPGLDGKVGRVLGLNDDGTVLATVWISAGIPAGYLVTPDGTVRSIPGPPASHPSFFAPVAISGRWVLGTVHDQDGKTAAAPVYRYDIDSGQFSVLPAVSIPPGKEMPGLVLAAGGSVAVGGEVPVIVGVGTTRRLASYGSASSYETVGISADGRTVIGNAIESNGSEMVLWTCD